MTATTSSSRIVLHADPEHGRLRLAIIFLLLAAILLLYYFLNLLWAAFVPEDFPDISFFTTCVSSIILGLAVVWVVEKGLKQIWHSGRSVALDDNGLLVKDGKASSYQLSWDGHVNKIYWYFSLEGYKRGGRERRVPSKWLCLAVQIQEGEHRVILFTYLSPKQAQPLLADDGRFPFKEIYPGAVYEKNTRTRLSVPERPEKIPADILAGKDGQYWLAEQRRWTDGFELAIADFEILLNRVG